MPLISPWKVAFEYILLTLNSIKTIDARINNLEKYFAFYGFDVIDKTCFKDAFTNYLNVIFKNINILKDLNELDKKFTSMKKENAYKKISISHCMNEKIKPKKQCEIYRIFNRNVSWLFSAYEAKITQPKVNSFPKTLEEYFEEITINEVEENKTQKIIKSVYLKRSHSEQTYTKFASIFSKTAIAVILSYLDCEVLNDSHSQYIVIKDVVATLAEVFTN